VNPARFIPHWLNAEIVGGALMGVILTLIGQLIYDSYKERRRIESQRDELYRALAEITADNINTVLAMAECAKKQLWNEVDQKLSRYQSDVTGVFCTGGSEREFTLEGSWQG
jgi:hypothetical protein